MHRFIIQKNAKKERWKLRWAYFSVIFGVFYLVFFLFFDSGKNGGEQGMSRIVRLVFAVTILSSGISGLRNRKRERFIEFSDGMVSWSVDENVSDISSVLWDDVRWIKFESNQGITFFRQSSFSQHIPLPRFPENERDKIIRILLDEANAREIRLVNASGQTFSAV